MTARLAPAQADSGAAPPRSAEALAMRYKNAHQAKNIQAIEQLFHWGSATPEMRRSVVRSLQRDVPNAIRSATIRPLSGNEQTEYVQGGVTYRTTLRPVARLEIEFVPRTVSGAEIKAERTSYFVGVRDGNYFLVTAEPVPNAR